MIWPGKQEVVSRICVTLSVLLNPLFLLNSVDKFLRKVWLRETVSCWNKKMRCYLHLCYDFAVTYCSKKQPTVALSSNESEYMALLHALKLIWLLCFLKEIG
jgi:hypothetical protein